MNAAARIVSIVAHPFAMVAVMVAVASARFGTGERVSAGPLLITGAALLPVAFLMVRQVRRGRWANVDASNARERPILFAVALASMVAVLTWLLLTNPQSFLIRGLLVTAAMVVVSAIVTRWMKLSLHVAFAAMAATALSLGGSLIGYALIAVVPLLAWSRLALGRHRPVELVAGAALGALAGLALVRL